MSAIQRKPSPIDLRKTARKTDENMTVPPKVKSHSSTSSDDDMDMQTPKQLLIQNPTQMPVRYESDEESVSPCADEFEDAHASFSDAELDSFVELDENEVPALVEATEMPIKSAKPLLVNISKLAPMNKSSTAAHLRPQAASAKTSIAHRVVARAINGRINGPSVVTLSKQTSTNMSAPPSAPPIPARSGARTPLPVSDLSPTTSTQKPSFPPRRESHASHPSVSTVASNYDDDNSSVSDSAESSAPSSVADESEIMDRKVFFDNQYDMRRDTVARVQDAELERAISEYMSWRSQGSPDEDAEEKWQAAAAARGQMSPRQRTYGKDVERNNMTVNTSIAGHYYPESSDESDSEWRMEIEKGLATPTPTTYATYDPFNVEQPTLTRTAGRPRGPRGPGLMPPIREEVKSGPIKGLRRGFGMVRRNL